MRRIQPLDLTTEDREALAMRLLRAPPPDGHRFVLVLNTLGLYHDTRDASMMLMSRQVHGSPVIWRQGLGLPMLVHDWLWYFHRDPRAFSSGGNPRVWNTQQWFD